MRILLGVVLGCMFVSNYSSAQVSLTYADPSSANGPSTGIITDSGGNPTGPVWNPLGPDQVLLLLIKNGNSTPVNYRIRCIRNGPTITTFGLQPGQVIESEDGYLYECEPGPVVLQQETSPGSWQTVFG